MAETASVRQAGRREPPPLDKRIERFVRRYIDSRLKLEIIRTVARHPNQLYPLRDLAIFTDSQPSEVEHAVFELEHLGLVATKRQQEDVLTGLSRSPVVRETATHLFRYASQPEGHGRLMKMLRARR